MSTHANLSPSKRHRWALCPGSIREEAKYPDDTSGPAAIDGTHSHTLLEHCIDAGLIDPTTQVGEVMADDDGEFKVDADRAARVKTAIEYIRERSMGGMLKVISEERVDPKHLLGRDDLSGTVDCQIIGPDWIELIDYKDGMGVVEAEGSRVRFHGELLPLTRRELGLLLRLLSAPQRIHSREVLLDAVWGMEADSSDRTVDTHIKTLRAKLHELYALAA
jgi:hypothetical protein